MSLGKNIQNQRKIKGMSQEKVAEQCKVTRQTVSRWECDEVLPDTNNLISLSKLFEVSLDTLVFSENVQAIDIQPQKNKWKNKCFLSVFINICLLIVCLFLLLPKMFAPKSIEGIYQSIMYDQMFILEIECRDNGKFAQLYQEQDLLINGYLKEITKSGYSKTKVYELQSNELTFTIEFNEENENLVSTDLDWLFPNIKKIEFIKK